MSHAEATCPRCESPSTHEVDGVHRCVNGHDWPADCKHEPRAAGRWEVIPDDDRAMFRIRWSEPGAGGKYLWVGHYPQEHLADSHAKRINAEGKQPWEYRTWTAEDQLAMGQVEVVAPAPQSDPVAHPPHYTAGAVEAIDAIRSMLGSGYKDFLRGQVLKYIWRMPLKGAEIEDAKKAQVYLDRLIKELTA